MLSYRDQPRLRDTIGADRTVVSYIYMYYLSIEMVEARGRLYPSSGTMMVRLGCIQPSGAKANYPWDELGSRQPGQKKPESPVRFDRCIVPSARRAILLPSRPR